MKIAFIIVLALSGVSATGLYNNTALRARTASLCTMKEVPMHKATLPNMTARDGCVRFGKRTKMLSGNTDAYSTTWRIGILKD